MKKKSIVFFFPFLLYYSNLLGSLQRITFFLKPDTSSYKMFEQKLAKPGKIARHNLYGIMNPQGIFASYAGYLTISDTHGQISFPRHQTEERFFIVITQRITPILMANNTIHHWELEKGTPAKIYVIEKQYDKETDLHYWNVEERPLPTDAIIPVESIIIFGKPKNIYASPGISLTNDATHTILPDIYIRKSQKINPTVLYVLNIKNYFRTIEKRYKTTEYQTQEHLVT